MVCKASLNKIVFGNLQTLETVLFNDALQTINYSDYTDKRIVIKGCGNLPVTTHAYVELVNGLRPFITIRLSV